MTMAIAAAPEQQEDVFTEPDIEQAYEAAGKQIGRVNIAVFGKTGVGKSTLINAIFGEDVALTGIGRPVTQGSKMHVHTRGHLGIVDNEGLEIGKDSRLMVSELAEYVQEHRQKPLAEQIHLAWYCVLAGENRFEDFEEQFVTCLQSLDIPVILVLTQVPIAANGIHSNARALAAGIGDRHLPIVGGTVVLTSALGDSEMGYGPHGLQDLLDRSFRVAPEGVRLALAAAQRIDMGRKRKASANVIAAATAAAAVAGATPIPFADAAVLMPIQTIMMMKIAHVYGLKLGQATAAALMATGAATTVGRSVVTGLLRLIPGVNVAVMVISGSVAATLTAAMGAAWDEVCRRICTGRLDPEILSDKDELVKIFLDTFKRSSGKELKNHDQ